MSRKVYCSYNHTSEANFLVDHLGFKRVNSVEECDVVVIGGGEDINPAIYGQEGSTITRYFSNKRDAAEIDDFYKAVELGKKIMGTCRGHQLLSCLCGAYLIQDVANHTGDHNIVWEDGDVTQVTSCHHQMVYPFDLDPSEYKVLAWATPRRSSRYLISEDRKIQGAVPFEGFVEVESIWFPRYNAIGWQFHP